MVRASKSQARRAASKLELWKLTEHELWKRRRELVQKCWRRCGEPWSGGEDKALKVAVRKAIGHAKLPKSISARSLGMSRDEFNAWCVELGRTPEAVQARWHMLMFCACRGRT
jgi:hypothetical protein